MSKIIEKVDVGMKRMIRLYYDSRTNGKWKLAI